MTQNLTGQPVEHLAPLLAALRERADRDAADLLAAADAEAEATVAHARAEADALLADARDRGEADAADLLAAEQARAQRDARAVVLRAQEEVYEQARDAARDAVSALREDPGYPKLLATLRARVERELGPQATVVELPRGGIEATLDDRRLEFALDGLADDLLDRSGGDLAELWAR